MHKKNPSIKDKCIVIFARVSIGLQSILRTLSARSHVRVNLLSEYLLAIE